MLKILHNNAIFNEALRKRKWKIVPAATFKHYTFLIDTRRILYCNIIIWLYAERSLQNHERKVRVTL